IDWGDSTPADTSATVSYAGGVYTVNGSHLYAEEGNYSITITVTDDGEIGRASSRASDVNDADLVGSSAATATGGIEGAHVGAHENATLTATKPGDHTVAFTTSIDWGDSTPADTSATVSYAGGVYTVNGSHLYAEEGNYSITITVTDDGGKTTLITGSTHANDADILGSSAATATGGIEGVNVATL